ncbi:MAG: hypothetical protein SGJ11_17705 [Phycisphaerae bacterium]|nr:hypothetical protein [Phycisphaerae bacterium]
MRKLGAVGVGWLVCTTIDQVLGFMTAGIGKAAPPGSDSEAATPTLTDVESAMSAIASAGESSVSGTQFMLAAVIGAVAGFGGGWIAATIDEDFAVVRNLAILLIVVGGVIAAFAATADYNRYAMLCIVSGIAQGAGSIIGGRVKYG